jgi:butyryl-CoA dehydrogenase
MEEKSVMDFNFTKQQEMIRTLMKNFTENEIRPIAADIDKEHRFPLETFKKFAKYNFFAIPFPKEYGGSGGDYLSYVLCIEEMAKACLTTSTMYSGQVSLVSLPIYTYGTAAQKEKYLPGLVKGEKIGSFALTEPNAGTDSAAQQTTAVLDGDHYILNGSKVFITNGAYADIVLVFAMTDKSTGNKGISAFIVESAFPGFSVGKVEDKLGIRGSSTAELIFNNVRVPKENLLGKENGGFPIAMQTLDGGRVGIAAQAVGLAQGALDESIKYMKERVQFGKPISAFQGMEWIVDDMALHTEAARLLTYKAAMLKQEGKNFTMAAAMAKLYASENAMNVTTKAVQLHGGYGFMTDYPIERYMRDAKITEIYEGTSQVQRMVISGNLFR